MNKTLAIHFPALVLANLILCGATIAAEPLSDRARFQAHHHVATVTGPSLDTAEQPAGLLPGWKAIALKPGQRGPVLRWSTPLPSGTPTRLRIAIAIDDRGARKVEAMLAESGETVGTFDIRFASPFQPYEIPLSATESDLAAKAGVRLQLLDGTKPLWILSEYDSPDAGADPLLPHLMQAGETTPMEEFPARLCSIASLQQFSWMGGCVLDGFWALGDCWQGQNPRKSAQRQIELYLAGGGREGLWVEGTLPYATVGHVSPDHPILQEALKYLLAKRDDEGAIISGTTTTAEGNYTVAYPLAVLAKVWNRRDLEDLAILQLRVRRQRLVDENGDLWLRHHRGSDGTHRSFPGWSRGVAWYALGLARTLGELDHRDDIDDLKAELCRVCQWAMRYQRSDGLWGVFLAEPELTADTAGSAGIAAALAWAAQRGWADASCRNAAEETLVGLKPMLTPDGFLTGMSPSNKREAGIGLQRSDYRVNCQTAMGLLAQLLAALESPQPEKGRESQWRYPDRRFRTSVSRATPWRDAAPQPVEVAIDFPLLLESSGVEGLFDPALIRVVERKDHGAPREVPFAYRTEFNARANRRQDYLAWIVQPVIGKVGAYDVYFDVREPQGASREYLDGKRGATTPAASAVPLIPPENLLKNPGFESQIRDWTVEPTQLVRTGSFVHTIEKQSLKIVVDDTTPADVSRDLTLSQKIDVSQFAGQEAIFECDLLAERAAYGAPVTIRLEQFRADGSRIPECVVQPRWLTIELAEGQLVQVSERGRINPEAATVNVLVRMKCHARDADTHARLTGPESHFTIWLDRVVFRPGERWPWPADSETGFVKGSLEDAPLNRGFEFTGGRRLAFIGSSEGSQSIGQFNPDPKSIHWGPGTGTLEFWCRPLPLPEESAERVFFDTEAYGHRTQAYLRERVVDGERQLEFMIADSSEKPRVVHGPVDLEIGRDYHIAATWDFPRAHLQLYVDGQRIAELGPYEMPWPSSLKPDDMSKPPGIGVTSDDRRSMPMQAFIGGDRHCDASHAAEAVVDEFRISDVVRYHEDFAPQRHEFAIDAHTRALFHFENEHHGVHDSDDEQVRGHLACELPRQADSVPLEILNDGDIERRMVLVKPHAAAALFERNRAESRLPVTRPFEKLPDPRFIEYRPRQHRRTVAPNDEGFLLNIGGDYEPLMRSITFEPADDSSRTTTLLPRWRANDNVVPFSAESLAATLAPDAENDAEKAIEVMRYALETSNYFNADFCETLADRHRSKVAYTLTKALNIYPHNQCGPLNHTLRKLFLTAGISSNDAAGTHHQFQQAFYGGGWRLFDVSPRKYWLLRDNVSVASRRDFEDDLYLKLRQGDSVNSALPRPVSVPRFGAAERPHTMDFALCPDERVSVCWHNEGGWFEVTGENRQSASLAKIPPYFGNGAIIYWPSGPSDGTVLDNAAIVRGNASSHVLRGGGGGKSGALIYKAECPYIYADATVNGFVTTESTGDVKISLSYDEGDNWHVVWQSSKRGGMIDASLRDQVTGRYAYWLKVELAADSQAMVQGLHVRSTFVVSPLSLPGKLSLGDNRITFVGGPSTVPVATTCRWTERYQSELGVSLDAISYYHNSGEAHRNLMVVAPNEELALTVTLQGQPLQGTVSLENLPDSWSDQAARSDFHIRDNVPAKAVFTLKPNKAKAGDIEAFDVVVAASDPPRRVTSQVLVADSPLVGEAEKAVDTKGAVSVADLPELSGGRGILFGGEGQVTFDLDSPTAGKYALWLRARWEPGSSTDMTLAIDGGEARELRAYGLIGFDDWTSSRRAYTKMFAHYGEQFGHWSWYRIGDVKLASDARRLTLGAKAGAFFDAVLLLPENPDVDRAAMNLLQNWNYSPWAAGR